MDTADFIGKILEKAFDKDAIKIKKLKMSLLYLIKTGCYSSDAMSIALKILEANKNTDLNMSVDDIEKELKVLDVS